MKEEGYLIKTSYFEGPFDLLLFLVKKQEVEIENVNITQIITDYLKYLMKRTLINLDREIDFISVAASLIFLKSKSVLPYQKEEDEESEKVREEYTILDQLKEYEHIKHLMEILEENYLEENKKVDVNVPYSKKKEYELYPVSTFLLAEYFFKLMKRMEKEEYSLEERKFDLKSLINSLLQKIKKLKFLDFTDYFENMTNFQKAFFSFFALLELVRRGEIIAMQEKPFGKILVFPKSIKEKIEKTEIYAN